MLGRRHLLWRGRRRVSGLMEAHWIRKVPKLYLVPGCRCLSAYHLDLPRAKSLACTDTVAFCLSRSHPDAQHPHATWQPRKGGETDMDRPPGKLRHRELLDTHTQNRAEAGKGAFQQQQYQSVLAPGGALVVLSIQSGPLLLPRTLHLPTGGFILVQTPDVKRQVSIAKLRCRPSLD